MASEKELIQKLLKIAENQQKIINKLAQAVIPAAVGENSFADSIKNALKKLFPNMNVTSLNITDPDGKRPSLVMTYVPSADSPSDKSLKLTLTEQFLLNNKLPASLLVNGKELRSV